MKEIWKKHKLLIISLGFVLVAFLAAYFVVVPLIRKITEKADKIQEEIMDNDINKKKLDKIGDLEDQYNYFQQNKTALSVILDENEQVLFIKKLEGLAEETGNSISLKANDENDPNAAKNNNSGNKKKKDEEETIQEKLGYDKYFSLQINLEGSYAGLIRFVHKLENSTYYINVISITSKKETEKDSDKAAASSQVGSIFTPSILKPGSEAEKSTPEEKEFVSSVINIIVYTKK
jgi:hypothetical protein